MKYYIFRNSTVDLLFNLEDCSFSDYGDISIIPHSEYYIWIYTPIYDSGIIAKPGNILNYIEKLKLLIDNIPATSTILLFTMANTYEVNWQQFDFLLENAITEYNKELQRISRDNRNVKVIDFNNFIKNSKIKNVIDWRYYYLSGSEINPKYSSEFKKWFHLQMNGIKSIRKKCLILDLDNTLWGGVIGEDGIAGIALGEDYPGKAFQDFQRLILEAKENGVILAICSKNNKEDIDELFAEHPNMILKKDDFSSIRINWVDKATNIKEIASELNIGLDSMVFIDDNPRERNLVTEVIPEIAIPDFPQKPYELPTFFKSVYERYFLIYELTEEDKRKTIQYFTNIQRAEFKTKFQAFEDYIEKLEIVILFQAMNHFNISRISQMTQKTNQFNLTTKRYTEGDLLRINAAGNLIVCASVKDKFGDNGITALSIIILKDKQEAEIDTLLLSCRILGKNIEFVFLKEVLNTLFLKGYKKITAKYIKTKKNKQVEMFYDKMGFNVLNTEKGKEYELIMDKCFMIDDKYKILWR